MFLLNILLAIAWISLTGEFNFQNFLLGLHLAYVGLRMTSGSGGASYTNRLGKSVKFFFYFLWQVVISSVRVAAMVLSPKLPINPGVVAVPLRLKSDAQITLLANLITLTPGTLSLDVSADRKYIYVHVIDLDNVKAFRKEIAEGFEQRILDLTS